jgi:hypothetical protein
LEPTFGAGDTQVLEGFAKESQHFVPVTFRRDKIGVLVQVVDEPLLLFAHLEIVVGHFPSTSSRSV